MPNTSSVVNAGGQFASAQAGYTGEQNAAILDQMAMSHATRMATIEQDGAIGRMQQVNQRKTM